jgi:hypothetical protein
VHGKACDEGIEEVEVMADAVKITHQGSQNKSKRTQLEKEDVNE